MADILRVMLLIVRFLLAVLASAATLLPPGWCCRSGLTCCGGAKVRRAEEPTRQVHCCCCSSESIQEGEPVELSGPQAHPPIRTPAAPQRCCCALESGMPRSVESSTAEEVRAENLPTPTPPLPTPSEVGLISLALIAFSSSVPLHVLHCVWLK